MILYEPYLAGDPQFMPHTLQLHQKPATTSAYQLLAVSKTLKQRVTYATNATLIIFYFH
jgi:hypothetical protein